MIYSSPDQQLAQTTTRQNGVSSGPYTSNNLSYTVNDKKENVDQNRQPGESIKDCFDRLKAAEQNQEGKTA